MYINNFLTQGLGVWLVGCTYTIEFLNTLYYLYDVHKLVKVLLIKFPYDAIFSNNLVLFAACECCELVRRWIKSVWDGFTTNAS